VAAASRNVSGLFRDLRFAVRQLARNRAFTTAAVLTLGLGIGLNSAVFSIVNATLFRPLPVSAPQELVAVYASTPGEFMATSALGASDYLDLAERTRGLASFLAYTYAPVAVEHGDSSRLVLGVRATPGAFAALGVSPFLGRFFTPSDAPDTAVVVLSHAAWRRRYGADPGVVGTQLFLDGRPSTVIGVAPEEFFGFTRGVSPEVWTPLHLGRPAAAEGGLEPGWLWVLARRAPGTTLEQVGAELRVLGSTLASERPGSGRRRSFVAFAADAVRILPEVDARLKGASAVVLGVSALVLLIACTNVANLLLARAVARRREVATRRVLGAGTAAVVRLLLAEGLVLALLGVLLALGLAWVSNAAIGAVRLPLPVDLALGLALDGRVVLFTVALAAVAVLASALAPAVAAARGDVASMLREGGRSAGGALQRRLGGALVAAQVALCLVLLVDTGLALRSLRSAHQVDPGFEPRGVVAATFATSLREGRREELLRSLSARVRALPGVEAAGLASHLPLSVEITFDRVAPAASTAPPEDWPRVDSAWVGPGYFETLRIPVLRGRAVSERDGRDSPLAAVLNETLAARLWPGGNPVGRSLRVAGVDAAYVVVGVVGDGKYRTLGEAPRPFLYRAIDQTQPGGSDTGEITTGTHTLVVRSTGAAPAIQAELRGLLRRLDPRVATSRLGPLEDALAVTLFLPRVAAALFGVFGLLGLALSALGVYGLMAYTAGRRTREIGIRMALGATPGRVTGLLVRQGLVSASLGIAAGLAAARATSPALGAVLYGVEPGDPQTFGAVTAFLALVAWTASYLPARRAATLDVPRALREE